MGLRNLVTVTAAAAAVVMPVASAPAVAADSTGAAVPAATAHPPPSSTSAGRPVDLDVLFVGAHPDDESGTLSTLGEWGEEYGVESGVVTITRGEGGGNAIGPEEGPALGLIREAEERRAVAYAGIDDVFYLDRVDFYYTVSAPLTEQIWGHDSTLAKVVRVIRETRPEVVITMDPAPSPGNHGHHQYAARLAIEAFGAAADPKAYPSQLSEEGLSTWRADRLFLNRARGEGGTGRECPGSFEAADPAQNVYGVWEGRRSQRHDDTWAQVERTAQREYASQGWSGFPDVPDDPTKLGCDYFTQLASRVPFTPSGGSDAATSLAAMLQGTHVPAPGGLPLGTELYLTTDAFHVVPGQPVTVTAHVAAPERRPLGRSAVTLEPPKGWQVSGDRALGRLQPGERAEATFTVTPPPGADLNTRVRLPATLTTDRGHGYTDIELAVTPPVKAQQELLPRVAEFRTWAEQADARRLEGFVDPVLTLPSGRSRDVDVVVTNRSDQTQSGKVTVDLPEGFEAGTTSRTYSDLGAGESRTLTFHVTNTDASLPTSNEGGDYAYTITTTTSTMPGEVTSETHPALELVPYTVIPQAGAAPDVDGTVSPGEYGGETLDLSRRWEGEECTSAADCSATAQVTWHDDALYLAVRVHDDELGTKLDPADCKRHWRTDSVEIAIDPRGTSENTSTTFKTAILPVTDDPSHGDPPCYLRDADNHQGPGPETAPGMEIASTVSSPYEGYTIETKIPMSELPGAVDPEHMGLNMFVYDSDTQDLTGQTRIGWSTWGGVQGDPYRWGVARLEEYTPPPGRPTTPPEPIIPQTALRSIDSPQTIAQAVRDNVPIGGDAAAPDGASAWVTGQAEQRGERVVVRLRATGPGTAHLFVYGSGDGGPQVLGGRTVEVPGQGGQRVSVRLNDGVGDVSGADVLAGFRSEEGGTLSSRAPVR